MAEGAYKHHNISQTSLFLCAGVPGLQLLQPEPGDDRAHQHARDRESHPGCKGEPRVGPELLVETVGHHQVGRGPSDHARATDVGGVGDAEQQKVALHLLLGGEGLGWHDVDTLHLCLVLRLLGLHGDRGEPEVKNASDD